MLTLLAETVTGDTPVSLGLIVTIGSLLVGGGIGAVVSRVSQAKAIDELRRDMGELNEWRKEQRLRNESTKTDLADHDKRIALLDQAVSHLQRHSKSGPLPKSSGK